MIKIQYEPPLKRSAAYDETKLIGECDYQESNQSWTIFHTEVNPEYGGQGIARKLVECVLDEAEQKGIEIKATCSYAVKVLKGRS